MARAPDQTDRVTMPMTDSTSILRTAAAGLLGWIVPGLGHIFIGDRVRGTICLAAIVLTFWTGVAIGGVRGTIDPRERSLWFIAQVCTGVNAGVAYTIRQSVAPIGRRHVAMPPPSWVSAEIGVHYTGVAGLLNILVILDAMARSERRNHRGLSTLRGPPPESSA